MVGVSGTGFGFVKVSVLLLLIDTGVTALVASRGLVGSGVSRSVCRGDRFRVRLVLGTLLARLRYGVGLKL